MNYLIMYLTSCVAIDKDSCCNIKPIIGFHGMDDVSVNCMAGCAVEMSIGNTASDDNFELHQTQCTADCLGRKKGYVTKDGTFLSDKFLDIAQESLRDLKHPKLVESCVNEYRNETELPDDSDFNDVELKIFYCIFKEIQLKCPLLQQRQPSKCMELQKYLRNDHKLIPRSKCDDTERILRDLATLLNKDPANPMERELI